MGVGKLVRASIELCFIIVCSCFYSCLNLLSQIMRVILVSFTLLVTLLCNHGHPSLILLMVTLLFTHVCPFVYAWSPFFSLMTPWCPYLTHALLSHSWHHFSALLETHLSRHGHFFSTHNHPFLHSWSPFSTLMVPYF